MAIVAIAGGTGGIGRALVEAIIGRGVHQVKVLSRKPNDAFAKEYGISVIPVDYANVEDLTKVFEREIVDTVISALSTLPEAGTPPEVNLVRAAQASTTTRRFVPSNWGIPLTGEVAKGLPSTVMKVQTLEALAKTELEYTSFYVGFLADFFGAPAVKTYMNPMTVVVDLAHDMAAIPGSGNTPVVFTHTFDLAKFVDQVLDIVEWEREYYIIGDKVTWNKFVEIAEKAKGIKFKIVHDSVETLRKGQVTELPALTKALPYIPVPKEHLLAFSAAFGLMFDDGSMGFDDALALNAKYPDIKTIKIKDVVEAAVAAM